MSDITDPIEMPAFRTPCDMCVYSIFSTVPESLTLRSVSDLPNKVNLLLVQLVVISC